MFYFFSELCLLKLSNSATTAASEPAGTVAVGCLRDISGKCAVVSNRYLVCEPLQETFNSSI
jgi:hypothetical protein